MCKPGSNSLLVDPDYSSLGWLRGCLGRQARDLVGTRQTTGYYLRQSGRTACPTQPGCCSGGRLTSIRGWFLKLSPSGISLKNFWLKIIMLISWPKRVLVALELELQVVLSHLVWLLEIEPGSFVRAASARSHRTIIFKLCPCH